MTGPMVEIALLRPQDPRTREILDALQVEMGWLKPFVPEGDQVVRTAMIGVDDPASQFADALGQVADDWADYFDVRPLR